MFAASIFGHAVSNTATITKEEVREIVAPVVYAETLPKTLQEQAADIAKEYGISTTSLFNLIKCESGWDTKARGKDGEIGLVQIMPHWGFTQEQLEDPDFSMRFAAEKLSKNQGHIWTCGNCYSYAVTQIGKLPPMAEILPNTDYPKVGGLIIFNYNGLKHIAVITKVTEGGIWVNEANYEENLIAPRLVRWDDPHKVGYWERPELPTSQLEVN